MCSILVVGDLRKSYGNVPALVGVDLTIEAGEICALLGPNGAGKSSLVSIVAGLLRSDSGSVIVNGIDVNARPAAARAFIGLAAQDLAIYPTVSVHDNLVLFGQLAGLRRKLLRDRIDDAAEQMGLGSLLSRQARHLSGGEKRRLHTAIALLARPPLLLLDEPTAGVDVGARAQMIESIRRLASEQGCAVCYSTHYLGEVEHLSASVAVLDHGQIIARGDVDELIRKHARSAVELAFDGPPPVADLASRDDLDMEVDQNILRLYGDDPASIAASVLPGLTAGRGGLRAVDFVTPSLEAAFLALTGRRWDTAEDHDGEGTTVPEADVVTQAQSKDSFR